MNITVMVVGRAGEPLKSAIEDYEARAKRYWRLRVVELSSGAVRKHEAGQARQGGGEAHPQEALRPR